MLFAHLRAISTTAHHESLRGGHVVISLTFCDVRDSESPEHLGPVAQRLYYGASSAIMAPCPVFKSKTFLKTPTESCGSERRARISPYRNTFEAV
jgi:hypothetical protein